MENVVTCGVYPKLDYFQAVFNDVDFAYVLEWLGLPVNKFGDFLTNSYERGLGYDTHIGYRFENISIETRADYLLQYNSSEGNDLAFWTFSKVFLIVSGKGLDYLRSQGIDVDHNFRRQPAINELTGKPVMHPTRCDFAFDLINYQSSFLDDCLSHLSNFSDRVPLCSMGAPIKFSVRTGDQKTLYLGSPRSDKLLRVYDKKMEQSDRYGNLASSPVDYDVDSWIRVEYQTRNDETWRILYGEGDYLSIFRYIFDRYTFKAADGKPAQFWLDLFNWDEIPAIVQNANWVSPSLDREKCDIQFLRALKIVCAFECAFGSNYVEKRKHEFMDDLYSDGREMSYKRRSFERILDCLLDWSHDFSKCVGAYILPTKRGSVLRLRPYDRK